MLEAREKAKCKDLSEFDKGKIVIATGSEHLQNCSYFGVFLDCSGQDLSIVVQGISSGEPATEAWKAKAN